jgi:hypothetical protein
MGPILYDPRDEALFGRVAAPPFEPDPIAAARGIVLALAVSALLWIALALAVPLVW